MTDQEKKPFEHFKPRFVSGDGQKIAKEISRLIFPDAKAEMRFADDGPVFILTSELLQIIGDAFKVVSQSPVVAVLPEMTELSLGETAQILFTSEEHVNELLDSGKLKSHHFGGRHIFLKDVLEYHQEFKRQQHEALAEMVRWNQEMGLYDDVPENYYQGKEKGGEQEPTET